MDTMNAIGQPGTISMTYTGAPRGPRYDAWREHLRRGFCGLDVQPSKGEQIRCRLEIVPLSFLALATPDGTSAQFSRTRDLLSDACDDVVLINADSGRVSVTQSGRDIELSASQMCLTDTTVPGATAIGDHGRFSSIRIPRRQLLGICPKAEDRLSQPLRENAALRDTIARYYALAFETAAHQDAPAQQLTAQHLVDLIGLLLGMRTDERDLARTRGLSAAQLKLVQAEALRSLSDDSMTVELIARRCGVSPRHVQRLFERAGTTFTEFVLEQRLLLARKMLESPGSCRSKISAIASDAGFSDISYFNRVFRRRFGATPSELRRNHWLSADEPFYLL
jgi:AraC-like DNA-binding protein